MSITALSESHLINGSRRAHVGPIRVDRRGFQPTRGACRSVSCRRRVLLYRRPRHKPSRGSRVRAVRKEACRTTLKQRLREKLVYSEDDDSQLCFLLFLCVYDRTRESGSRTFASHGSDGTARRVRRPAHGIAIHRMKSDLSARSPETLFVLRGRSAHVYIIMGKATESDESVLSPAVSMRP